MQTLGIILGATVCVQYLQLLIEHYSHMRMNRISLSENTPSREMLSEEKIGSGMTWNGRRTFVVACKIQETASVVSFHLIPQDGKPLPKFFPGQHVMLALKIPDQKRSVKRCYSLSAGPNREYYRITVKQVPDGLASTFLHREVHVGDTLDVYAPAGKFRIEDNSDQPLVLISGGVGITPFLSVLEDIAVRSFRETILILSVRDGEEHIRKASLERIALEHPHIQVYTFYTAPNDTDIQGLDYQGKGRITLASIQEIVRSQECEFYLCGSKQMTQSLYEQLTDWGVADESIQMEGFGDPTTKPVTEANTTNKTQPTDSIPETVSVLFKQSNKTVEWNPAAETILGLAEQNGIELESVCRSGDCGACRIRILAGCVEQQNGSSGEPQTQTCLPCTAKPVSDVILNA